MEIQVRIHEEGALRNQRFAFANQFTVVSELLQDARRAGAHHIVVDYSASGQTLLVQDDGRGIKDLQKLLSLHESGWDDTIVVQENPFGIGFTICLFAAQRVIVSSGRQRVDIDTAAALRGEAFAVEVLPDAIVGTRVELRGFVLTGLEQRMAALCRGFPVDVVFNGERLERRYAVGHLPLVPSPIGAIHLAGARTGMAVRHTMIFLQGFCVKEPSHFDVDTVNVVHLDPQQFTARLPDRDSLIDRDQQLLRIEEQLKMSWRVVLEDAKNELAPLHFVEIYFDAMRQWGHADLLNDMDEVPTAIFERIVGYPIQVHHNQRNFVHTVDIAPTREEIEEGRVTLVSLGRPDSENLGHWMLARHKQWLVAHANLLDAGHWLRRHVRYIEHVAIQIEPRSETARVTLDGRWVRPLVVLCQFVRIRLGKDAVDILNEGVAHNGDLLVPIGETNGTPVRQLSTFIDENDRCRADDMEADRAALAELIRCLRSSDPVATLDALLADLNLGRFPLLHGRQFSITVGVGHHPGHSVALLDSDAATPAKRGVVAC